MGLGAETRLRKPGVRLGTRKGRLPPILSQMVNLAFASKIGNGVLVAGEQEVADSNSLATRQFMKISEQ